MTLKDLYRETATTSGEDSHGGLQVASHWLAGKLRSLQNLTFEAAVEFKRAARLERLSSEPLPFTNPRVALEHLLSELRCLLDARDPIGVDRLERDIRASPLWHRLKRPESVPVVDAYTMLSEQADSLRKEWDEFWRPLRRELPYSPEWTQAMPEKSLRKGLSLFPGFAGLHFVAFRKASRNGDQETAERALRAASTLEPGESLYAGTLIPVIMQRYPTEAAMEQIQGIYLEWRSRSSLVLFVYALALLYLSGKDLSAEALRQALNSALDAQHLKPEELTPQQKALCRAVVDFCQWRLGGPGTPPPRTTYAEPGEALVFLPSPDPETYASEILKIAVEA